MLTVRGTVPGMDETAFKDAAEAAKKNCPVSQALAGIPDVRLKPRSPRSLPCAAVAALDDLIAELERSYTETRDRMSDPAVYNDHREAAEVGRRLKQLEGPYVLSQDWRQAQADLAAARGDSELAEMVGDYEAEVARLEEELKLALAERDPADDKDVIVEVRQGVGGDEAALWADELQRMLQRYAERRGFKVEQLETAASDGGGVKEAVFAIKGDGAYSVFKFEGGIHRVQRVPRPSPRVASTRRRPPSPSCRKRKTSTSRSTRET